MKNIQRNIRSNIPNGITCLNVLCGTLSIIASGHSGLQLWGLYGWQWAALLIVMAAVADFFDGFAARYLHEMHTMGAELDSLSDQVSFGVAPAMLLVFTLLDKPSVPVWLAFLPVLIAVATAVRLAKFNVDTRQSTGFLGMPVPANAVLWIGYVASLRTDTPWLSSPWVLIPALAFVCWLMVSEVPMLSLKFKSWGFKENLARYLLMLGAAVIVALMQLRGMLWVIVYYAVLSLVVSRSRPSANH